MQKAFLFCSLLPSQGLQQTQYFLGPLKIYYEWMNTLMGTYRQSYFLGICIFFLSLFKFNNSIIFQIVKQIQKITSVSTLPTMWSRGTKGEAGHDAFDRICVHLPTIFYKQLKTFSSRYKNPHVRFSIHRGCSTEERFIFHHRGAHSLVDGQAQIRRPSKMDW